jgi:hypothetical protein
MLDAVGGAIDKASSLLGGASGAAPTKGKAEFLQGEALGNIDDGAKGAVGPNVGGTKPNALDLPPLIEFVHYGRAHDDSSRSFPDKGDKQGRARMFRDALEREAVLLHGFISSCQTVLQEYQDNRGLLGEIGQAVDKLVGSGSTEPSPAELDAFKKAVETAGGSINKTEIKYPDIHKAGVDLHQARADFNAFAEKVKAHYLKPGESGPGAALTALPGVAKAALSVQKIIFKAFDIYLAMYLNARAEYEDGIEEASYKMTLKAIRETLAPTYPVWFPAPKPADKGDGTETKKSKSDPLSSAIQDVKDKVDEAEKDVKGAIEDVIGSVDESVPAPGDEQFEAAFAVLLSGGTKRIGPGQTRERKKAPDLVVAAFKDIAGELPEFLVKPISEIAAANVEMLKAIYKKILKASAAAPISEELLLQTGREYLTQKVIAIVADLVPFLSILKSPDKLVDVQGMGVSGKQVGDKGASLLDDAVGKQLEIIIDLAVKQLGAKLAEAQKAAADQNAVTMEIFLGRLPWLYALMVRNTFFPIWDLLVEKVFGSIAGPLGSAMSPIKSFLGDAKAVVGEAKKIYDKVNKAKDQLAQGVNQDNVDEFIGGLTGDAASGGPGGGGQSGPSFPGGKREVEGKGLPVDKPQIDFVQRVTVAPA